MKPSTNPSAEDRAILCQRGNELAEFEPLLAELGLSVEVVTGELPSAAAVAGARLVIVAGQRLAEGRLPAVRSWPRTLAVIDDGSRTLVAHLSRIGVSMILRRPIHPRALRLLLLHELYRGPERRGKKRVLIGHPIRAGGALFKQGATLLELSRTGARIALANPPKIGSAIQFVLGKDLTNGKPIPVRARVVRSIENGQGGRAGEREIGVALLDPAALAKPIQAILDRFALGPASTGSGLRAATSPARSSTSRTTDVAHPALPLAKRPAPPAAARDSAPAAPAPRPEAGATAPDTPRRLPPSYRPAIAPSPIAKAHSADPATKSSPALPDDAPATLELGFAATEIEILETDFDLELDEEIGSSTETEHDDGSTFDVEPGGASQPARTDGGERRRSQRVAYDQRVVALDEQAARVVVGRDLCIGGMRIEANPDLAVGDVLRIALHSGSDTQPLMVLAGVERDDGEDGLVLAFASLSAPQRERLEKILAANDSIQGVDDGDGEQNGELIVGELLARVARRPETRSPTAGFTLVELMIVVAIIGLLASIAVPQFVRYQLRAKSAEAVANLGAIRVVQETHFTEHGAYLAANAEPPLIPGPSAVPFDISGTNYAQMGWSPDGRVYFSYAVATSADQTGYTADAAADIDGNGILQIWGYVKPDPVGGTIVGQLGCDPALLAPEHIGTCTGGSPAF